MKHPPCEDARAGSERLEMPGRKRHTFHEGLENYRSVARIRAQASRERRTLGRERTHSYLGYFLHKCSTSTDPEKPQPPVTMMIRSHPFIVYCVTSLPSNPPPRSLSLCNSVLCETVECLELSSRMGVPFCSSDVILPRVSPPHARMPITSRVGRSLIDQDSVASSVGCASAPNSAKCDLRSNFPEVILVISPLFLNSEVLTTVSKS